VGGDLQQTQSLEVWHNRPMSLINLCLYGEVFIDDDKLEPQASLSMLDVQKQSHNMEVFSRKGYALLQPVPPGPKLYRSIYLVAHTRHKGLK
jgi:hypothetical protein